VFGRATNNSLQYGYSQGSNWTWRSLGGTIASSPSVVVGGSSVSLNVFARASNNVIYKITQKTQSDMTQWTGWTAVGGSTISAVTVVPDRPTASDLKFQVYGLGSDHALWRLTQSVTDGPYTWSSLGGYLVTF
jgi:hypothetical protein